MSQQILAFGICLTSLYFTFVMEMVAFRVGTARLKKLGIGVPEESMGMGSQPGSHGSHPGAHAGHIGGPADMSAAENAKGEKDPVIIEEHDVAYQDSSTDSPAVAQILGVAILECGVILHSLIIGWFFKAK